MSLEFGDKLKIIRTERHMSQEDMAKLLNTSKQVISRYETKQRTPKIAVVTTYAEKLGVPLEYLIDNNLETMPSKKPTTTNGNELDEVTELLKRPEVRKIVEKLLQLTPQNLEIALAQLDVLAKHQ